MDQHLNFGFTQNIMMCILLSCISVSPIAYMNNLSMLGFFFYPYTFNADIVGHGPHGHISQLIC